MNPIQFQLRDIDPSDPADHSLLSSLWTQACGDAFALSPDALAYDLRATEGVVQEGKIAFVEHSPVAFVLASCLNGQREDELASGGWINALVVILEYRKRGIGSALVEWGEAWLRAHGCKSARLGGSLRPFAPGVPVELDSADFLYARGYAERPDDSRVWDLAHDLRAYHSPAFLRSLEVDIRPAQEGDTEAIREFLQREFPGRWHSEFEQHLRDGARISDYWILSTHRGIDACCLMTLEDSVRTVERFFPSPLPRPWDRSARLASARTVVARGMAAPCWMVCCRTCAHAAYAAVSLTGHTW